MLKKTVFLFTLFFSISVVAQQANVLLSIENDSNKTIIVHKNDGTHIPVKPGHEVKNILFQYSSNASSYVNDRLSCVWTDLSNDQNECLEIRTLIYEDASVPTCRKVYHQTIPC